MGKLKKGKRKSHAAESRKGLASGKQKKQGNRLKSTGALVSPVANRILRGAIGSSLKKSEGFDQNKDQFRHLSDVTDEPDGMLENLPGCGSTQPKDTNQHPWLGALYAVPLDPPNETEDRFVVPVALLLWGRSGRRSSLPSTSSLPTSGTPLSILSASLPPLISTQLWPKWAGTLSRQDWGTSY